MAPVWQATWTSDFGVPDILMMRSLAERAPMLFRKNVVSVDVLTQSEEAVLEVITGCFAQAGGVPELGLGNAEVCSPYPAVPASCVLLISPSWPHAGECDFQYVDESPDVVRKRAVVLVALNCHAVGHVDPRDAGHCGRRSEQLIRVRCGRKRARIASSTA